MSYSDMQTRQQRYFERKVTEGYKQVTFMLSAAGISELDRLAAKAASRLKAAQKWLRPRKLRLGK